MSNKKQKKIQNEKNNFSQPEMNDELEKTENEQVEEKPEEMILFSKTELEKINEDLKTAQKMEKENLESWQRERADFSNYRKRIEKEQSRAAQDYKADILKKILVLSDDLELALRNKPDCNEASSWIDGIELINRKINTIFKMEGLERVEAEGVQFDPNIHQAISYEEQEGHESGEIIDVLQNGYVMGDRVIRPALVRVAK